MRVVAQAQACGYGERYGPIDVDLLFDEPTVALRGPWNVTDLVKIGPAADDLDDRFDYHLDFPGSTLEPGCDYERWTKRISGDSDPVVYGHVASDPAHPGMLALQYWFFYTYNEFNNLHEGDWEMIQLNFDAADAGEAIDEEPVTVGYSSALRAPSAPTGARTSSSWSTAPIPSSTQVPARTRTSTPMRCTSAAPPRRVWAATTHADLISSSARP